MGYQTEFESGPVPAVATNTPGESAALPVSPVATGGQAQQLYSDMSRKQWMQYLNTFVPVENQLIQYATDPNTVAKAVDSARTSVSDQFGARQGMLDRKMRGLGTELDADQQNAANRELGIQKSLADVAAVNNTRSVVQNRQMGIMGGPAPKLDNQQGGV